MPSLPSTVTRAEKSALGQFMTPAPVARFMSSLFRPTKGPIRVLEPSAGVGALAIAFFERWIRRELGAGALELVAHELDIRLVPALENALAPFATAGARVEVRLGDYLAHAADAVEANARQFTHAILNPPYRKISSSSEARHLCRRIGLETVNLYSAFVGLSISQLAPGGQLVAIVPRSFCNGPYYKPFREFILKRAAIRQIHLFDTRDQAFSADDVLQENVILLLERAGIQSEVRISASADGTFSDLRERVVPFTDVMRPDDAEMFIRVPATDDVDHLGVASGIRHSLSDLHIAVSTGPVVDFRLRKHLLAMPDRGAVPLLYPAHVAGREVTWPIEGFKKANAITRNNDTERWLFPAGAYTVVRRFSSKEERRRVVASIVLPESFPRCAAIGFENHLNVFHQNKAGLPILLAWGLLAYLNCSAVDAYFRRFNGHTQVNATDLRSLRYPSAKALMALGRWASTAKSFEQIAIDDRMRSLLRPLRSASG